MLMFILQYDIIVGACFYDVGDSVEMML